MASIDLLGVPHAYELTPRPPNSSSVVLVFIHGWLLSYRYWQPVVELLAQDYQCLCYDLRGFGDSQLNKAASDRAIAISNSLSVQANLASSYTLAAYARDLGILLEKLGIEKAWLLGHSLGGSIALWGADLFSEIVKGVICLNSGGGIYVKEEFERFRSAGQQLVKRRFSWLKYVPLIDLVFARAMVARPLSRHWARQRVLDFVKAETQAALGALLDSTTESEVHQLPRIVARLQQPVYFLAGAQDTIMEPKYVRHLASFHQLFGDCGSNVIEIADCGHMSMIEQPDLVALRIKEILSKHEWLD
ncbi:alpha/beta fold hydrolase [Oscillatoria salina]|uniref:alpha/beta fold hydrolase n=1 Tax=Oscillatoria salina TaxID=331517 RepID=UPI0013BDF699|nr:alpha/beta hydrolase [Oscillatoria salina]MBZ8183023.1 alpha/beta hydrolase [Oscillatoria salina IIICB1]NET86616.1 alpha/beta hydrolase [Kamptonema sp. SIO1D9]